MVLVTAHVKIYIYVRILPQKIFPPKSCHRRHQGLPQEDLTKNNQKFVYLSLGKLLYFLSLHASGILGDTFLTFHHHMGEFPTGDS